ncbi:MAG: hypothetical protein MZU97_02060 [Bacillus subtilis]|nr:hypothetical protein [Bacillus subtilis]
MHKKAQGLVEYFLIGILIISISIPLLTQNQEFAQTAIKNAAPKRNLPQEQVKDSVDPINQPEIVSVNTADLTEPTTPVIIKTDPLVPFLDRPDYKHDPNFPGGCSTPEQIKIRLDNLGYACEYAAFMIKHKTDPLASIPFYDKVGKDGTTRKVIPDSYLIGESSKAHVIEAARQVTLQALLDAGVEREDIFQMFRITVLEDSNGTYTNSISGGIAENRSFLYNLMDFLPYNPDLCQAMPANSYFTHTSNFTNPIEIKMPDCKVGTVQSYVSSPLVFDLSGDGIKTTDHLIAFDIDGDGKLDQINDVLGGVLTIRNGSSGLDLFGNNTDLDGDGKPDGYANGFDALKALAYKENLINGIDDNILDANDIKILEEKYNLGMKTSGYNSDIQTLQSVGITQINLAVTDDVTEIVNFDGKGNILMEQQGSSFSINNVTNIFADIWHVVTSFIEDMLESISSLF